MKIWKIKCCKNKEWLEKKYLKEKLSTTEIGKLCNLRNSTIWKWLRKFNIPTRSRAEAHHMAYNNHCNLSQEAIDWINGELLGDGSLDKISFYSARVVYSSKYPEYAKYVRDILKHFGVKQIGKIYEQYHNKSKTYSYRYFSRSYEELLPIYKQWYPNGKKVVPKDIKLTPLTVRQWYIGDGSLVCREKRNSHIVLCTKGFIVRDIEWLMEQLRCLGFKTTRWIDNIIRVSAYSTKVFLNYIGKCPVKCYQYKWNYKEKDNENNKNQ